MLYLMQEAHNTRLDYIDMAKGLAIICMIIGHMAIKNISIFIYSFHMPLFFLISGFFLRRDVALSKRFVQLAKPYAFTVLIMLCYALVLSYITYNEHVIGGNWRPLSILKDFIISIFYGSCDNIRLGLHGDNGIGALWFLQTLFVAQWMIHIVLKVKNTIIQLTIIIVLFAIAVISNKYILLPYALQTGASSLLFVYIGYRFKIYITTFNKLLFIIFLIVWAAYLYARYSYHIGFDMGYCLYSYPVIDVIGSISATYVIIQCMKMVSKHEFVKNTLSLFGACSLIVLCFHCIERNLPWGLLSRYEHFFGYSGVQTIIITLKLLWAFFAILFVKRFSILRKIFSIRLQGSTNTRSK